MVWHFSDCIGQPWGRALYFLVQSISCAEASCEDRHEGILLDLAVFTDPPQPYQARRFHAGILLRDSTR